MATQGTWALGHLRHSGTSRALGLSGTQGNWEFDLSGTRALERHLGTWALRHSGTLSLEALEALYLADSKELHDIAKEYGKVRKIDRNGQIGRNEKTDRNGLEKK